MVSVQIPKSEGADSYLWVPVSPGAAPARLRIFAPGGDLWQEAVIPAGEKPRWFVPLNVSAFAGEELALELDAPAGWFSALRTAPHPPAREPADRPLLHFTADRGWINDPNGLIFHDGLYHLFFQYNPYDIAWNNMHWGHAVSRDLISWEQLDTALFPDETGTMYSGSGICDREGLLGFGKDALAFFYTAAGGENSWSAGVPYTQKIAVLPPGAAPGSPLVKTGVTAVPFLAPGNRDPKVFWHGESESYVMVLYLEGHDFAILRSADLKRWEMSQRLTLGEAWECPDLFCLPIEGTGRSRWVFWAADGYYVTGEFDGFRFTPDGELRAAYSGQRLENCGGARRIPYAAQTFSGTEGRTVQIAWMRTPNRGQPYTGMMSVPVELSLIETPDGLRLRMPFVRELEGYLAPFASRSGLSAGETVLPLPPETSWMLKLLPGPSANLRVSLPFGELGMQNGILSLLGERLDVGAGEITLLADREILELRAAGDTVCAAWEIPPALGGSAAIHSPSPAPEAGFAVFSIRQTH